MIGLSVETKDEMLQAFSNRTFLVALYEGDSEVVDALYSRAGVQFSGPLGDGTRYVQNVEIARFEGFNARHVIDHWAVIGQDGMVKAVYRVVGDPVEVGPTMDCKFRPGELRIGLP